MKIRILFILVTVLFVTSFLCAGSAETELTFQGIPWYSSPNDVIKLLVNAGFTDGNQYPALQDSQNNGDPFFSHIGAYAKDKKVPYRYVFKEKDTCATNLTNQTYWSPDSTIAKQTIRNISFMYVSDQGGQRLVEVCVWFDKDADYDMAAVYDALVTAYGEPCAARNGKEYVWLGENSSIAILYNNDVVFALLDGLSLRPAEMKDTGF
jgi:hypothetical protein